MLDKERLRILERRHTRLQEKYRAMEAELQGYELLEQDTLTAKRGYEAATAEARAAAEASRARTRELEALILELKSELGRLKPNAG